MRFPHELHTFIWVTAVCIAVTFLMSMNMLYAVLTSEPVLYEGIWVYKLNIAASWEIFFEIPLGFFASTMMIIIVMKIVNEIDL